MVVFTPSPFAFLEMQFEGSAGAVELGEAAFGEAPEALDAVDMDLALGEGIALLAVFLDPQVLVEAVVDEPGIAAPAVADHGGLQRDMAPDKPLQCGLCGILDDLGEDPAAALDDAEDGLLVGAAPHLSRPEPAPGTRGAEPALIDLYGAAELVLETGLVRVNALAEDAEIAVHRVAVEAQNLRRLRRRQIGAEGLLDFSQPIGRQPILFVHLITLSQGDR